MHGKHLINRIRSLFIFFPLVIVGLVVLLFQKNYFARSELFFTVQDETLGLSFRIPKSFQRLPSQEVTFRNPNFLYVFVAPDVKDVECYVSRTKNLKEGIVFSKDLLAGLVRYLEERYEDTVVEETKELLVEKIPMAQVSIRYRQGSQAMNLKLRAGSTKSDTTFIGCRSPQSLFSFYQQQFDTILSSLNMSSN